MVSLNRSTTKLYYENRQLSACNATVVKVGADWVEFDRTVAYPEGGGQESDHGVILLPDGRRMRFNHVRKRYGNRFVVPDFPEIQVDGIVEHVIIDSDLPTLIDIAEGDHLDIEIDRLRRAQLSLSHTASHVLYMAVAKVKPAAIERIIGCHIRPHSARFDFNLHDRFTADEVIEIQTYGNEMVARGSEVTVYAHAQHADARYWECEGKVIPCGGTHIASTKNIGNLTVRRRNLGKHKERLGCEFNNAVIDTEGFS
jgi:Ser-tRNA(Ala) deacylase AlaX